MVRAQFVNIEMSQNEQTCKIRGDEGGVFDLAPTPSPLSRPRFLPCRLGAVEDTILRRLELALSVKDTPCAAKRCSDTSRKGHHKNLAPLLLHLGRRRPALRKGGCGHEDQVSTSKKRARSRHRQIRQSNRHFIVLLPSPLQYRFDNSLHFYLGRRRDVDVYVFDAEVFQRLG
jgi:hypothetical protein